MTYNQIFLQSGTLPRALNGVIDILRAGGLTSCIASRRPVNRIASSAVIMTCRPVGRDFYEDFLARWDICQGKWQVQTWQSGKIAYGSTALVHNVTTVRMAREAGGWRPNDRKG